MFASVYTSQQNGVTKCKLRHLLDVACVLILYIQVPSSYWSDAVLTTSFLINSIFSVLDGKISVKVFLSYRASIFCFSKSHWLCLFCSLLYHQQAFFMGCKMYFFGVTPNTQMGIDVMIWSPACTLLVLITFFEEISFYSSSQSNNVPTIPFLLPTAPPPSSKPPLPPPNNP